MTTEQPTIPADLTYLLTTDHIGHFSSIRDDGSIATYLMWLDWDGEHILTSSPVDSRKAQNWRANPHIGISVVDHYDDWRFITARGRVSDFRPDVGLEMIDRMSERYTGAPYRRRNFEREIFVIELDHVDSGQGGWLPQRRQPIE